METQRTIAINHVIGRIVFYEWFATINSYRFQTTPTVYYLMHKTPLVLSTSTMITIALVLCIYHLPIIPPCQQQMPSTSSLQS